MARVSRYADNKDQVLTLIAETARKHAKPPSVRDLAEDTQVGVATMHAYLTRLAEEGLITWQSNKHRSLKCTAEGFQKLSSLGWPST